MSGYKSFKANPLVMMFFIFFFWGKMTNAQSFQMPKSIPSGVEFGISLNDFKQVSDMSRMREDRIQTTRKAYFQPSSDPNINAIIYYFDKDIPANPLYQIIIRYEDRKLPRKNARSLFGPPNFTKSLKEEAKPNEWRIKPEKGPEVWAWVHKTTLVIAARIPGTEWDDEWDDN